MHDSLISILIFCLLTASTQSFSAEVSVDHSDRKPAVAPKPRSEDPKPKIVQAFEEEFHYDWHNILKELQNPKVITNAKALREALEKILKVEEELSTKLASVLKTTPGLTNQDKFQITTAIFNRRAELLENMVRELPPALTAMRSTFPVYNTVARVIRINASTLAKAFREQAAARDNERKRGDTFSDPGCPACQVTYSPLKSILTAFGLHEREKFTAVGDVVRENGKILALHLPPDGVPRLQAGPGENLVPINFQTQRKTADAIHRYYEGVRSKLKPAEVEQLTPFFNWYKIQAGNGGHLPPQVASPTMKTHVPPAAAKTIQHIYIRESCHACTSWKAKLRERGYPIEPGSYSYLDGDNFIIIHVDESAPHVPFVPYEDVKLPITK